MPGEPAPLVSRLSLALAAVAVILATAWALRTPPHPNSDRYDYLARAWHLTRGEAPAPLVVYPLRLAYPGAESLPAANLTRPPLWPSIVSMPMRLGATGSAAVLGASLCLLAIVAILARATPSGFGGLAALGMAAGFATWRALLGGGPELALGLLLLAVWTWTGSPRQWTRVAVLGTLLGLMPWLHPVGWLYAATGIGSRLWREPRSTLLLAAVLAVVIGMPWYAQTASVTGTFPGLLQGQAELQKSVYDAGGLGVYRTLDGVSAWEVVTSDPGKFLRHLAHNLREQLTRLDGWLAWPLVLIGLAGIRHDRWLALRDLVLLAAGFVVVSATSDHPRLLVPLLPVAALWVGAGAGVLHRTRFSTVSGLLPLAAVLPWVLPLGLSARPGTELRGIDPQLRDPTRRTVVEYGRAGTAGEPCFTDSSVLAWRSRRPGIAIPADPATLESILELPLLGEDAVLVASAGTESWWFADPAWKGWWEAREAIPLEGTRTGLIARLRNDPGFYVPAPLTLGADDAPDSLQSIPAPLAVREGLMLRPVALRSLEAMARAALEDGIHLRVTSAYRSFERQAQLHASAVERHGPDQRWVAAPGTSEHQLGTTVDFCDAAMAHVLEPGFADSAEGKWLAENASRFGWVRSYTEQNQEFTGYAPEPWHYRHLGSPKP